jgi:hypothetical protein
MLWGMKDLFLEYLRKPDLEGYLAVRKFVVEHEDYRPYSSELEELDTIIDEERYQEVLDQLPNLLPNLMLSPRLHLMLAYTHRRLGNEEAANMESAVARACAEGILMTGSGTEKEPWLVTRTSDEYDVLMFIDRTMARQELIQRDGRTLDHLTFEDGKDAWFDVTDAFKVLNKQFGKAPPGVPVHEPPDDDLPTGQWPTSNS